ncbi:PR-1-like protein [Byssothecium circinans]|uniref:PR-1-like protein n=1 Tax=Byssothecium circinans TaxID=147558 RepID=A0A6A5TAW3_9PLEO|nr:PR-1-like protein [Byssothecium circinans]
MYTVLPISLIFGLLSLQTCASILSIPDSIRARETASAEYAKDDAFREATLNVTNTYRKQHNATRLTWNDTLADVSRKWSEKCVFEHSGGPTGENLASGYPNASASLIAWGQERSTYDFKKGAFDKQTGHFTQMVWKATTSMGCGRTECNGNGGKKAPGWYVVCGYYPPGNVVGQFTQNVQQQVPEEEQPEGPSDPAVPTGTSGAGPKPEETAKECPQGGVCSSGWRVAAASGVLWRVVLVVWMGVWVWVWV